MSTSFGNSKSSTSISPAKALMALYRQEESTDHQIQQMKEEALAVLTAEWFKENPPTLQNMTSWGELLCEYLNHPKEPSPLANMPLATYLTFVMTLDEEVLIPSIGRASPRYDSFCKLFDIICWPSVHGTHDSLIELAKSKDIDLHAMMAKLESMSQRQMKYDMYALDNPGEYRECPAGRFMHALLGLSFNTTWRMPDDKLYHRAWDTLQEDDLECSIDNEPDSEQDTDRHYVEDLDIVAHLVNALPTSTEDAFSYFTYHDHYLLPEQKQHLLSMSLSHLEFPSGVRTLLNALYYNDSENDEEGQRIFAAINPAAQVLSTLIALYDDAEDVLQDLEKHPHVSDLIRFADASRQKENADALVASFEM